MSGISDQLQKLKERIRDCEKCPRNPKLTAWVFPHGEKLRGPHGRKVKGFEGDGRTVIGGKELRLMFVSYRPSTSSKGWDEFPNPQSRRTRRSYQAVSRYYGYLEHFRFENSHLTDLVKCQAPVRRHPSPQELRNCITSFFLKELEIINPDLIVVLSDDAHLLLNCALGLLGKDAHPHAFLHHYSQRSKRTDFGRELENLRKDIKRVQDLSNLCSKCR